MPRIAAAVTVVATVAVSIGINIARFPVVWEMVGSTEPSAESREPASATDSTNSPSVVDLSQVAPPESFAPPPIDPASHGNISGRAPSGSYDEPGVSTRFVSSRTAPAAEPASTRPDATVADVSSEPSPAAASSPSGPPPPEGSTTTSPVSDAPSAYSPPADGLSSNTRWPAELSPAMKYGSNRPLSGEPPEAKAAETPRPMVPVVWPESSPSPGQASVLPVSAEDKIERLPPIADTKPVPEAVADHTSDGLPSAYPSTGR